jgi:hypothetical protein
MPEVADVLAVSTPFESAVVAKMCPEPVSCPECAEVDNPWLSAFCRSNHCEVVDVRTDAISACTSDDDCVARSTYCCDDCAGNDPNIALRKDQVDAYRQQICGKTKCVSCAAPTSKHKAVCNPVRKHCEVAD